jgi:external thioesterase TEII
VRSKSRKTETEQLKQNVRLLKSGPESARLRFVCLPCAGGAASSFRPLMNLLPQNFQVVAVDPPGHGLNPGTPLDRVETMVDTYLEVLGDLKHSFLIGHSLGGLVAFLIASRLESRGSTVRGIILSACRAPPKVVDSHWSLLSDTELFERLSVIGGVPDIFLRDPPSFQAYLPSIRADFRALERFTEEAGEDNLRPIRAPLWVLAAKQDAFAPESSVQPWTKYGLSSVFQRIDGDHFFLQNEPKAFATWLAKTFQDD